METERPRPIERSADKTGRGCSRSSSTISKAARPISNSSAATIRRCGSHWSTWPLSKTQSGSILMSRSILRQSGPRSRSSMPLRGIRRRATRRRASTSEQVIGSIRRECLDHGIVLDERHLRRILREYVDYYHSCRTHLSLEKDAPEQRPVQWPSMGRVTAIPKVDGLIITVVSLPELASLDAVSVGHESRRSRAGFDPAITVILPEALSIEH